MPSDSDDELGDYSEAPVGRRPAPPPRPASSRSGKGQSQPRAGPSKARSKAAPAPIPEVEMEFEELAGDHDVDMEEAEVQEAVRPNGTARSRATTRSKPPSSAAASNSVSKGKGAARLPPPIQEEDSQEEVEQIAEEPAKRGRGRPAKAKGVTPRAIESVPVPSTSSVNSKRESKVEADLRKRLEEVTKQRDTYAEQFDDLVRLRSTEQDQALAEYRVAADERAKAQSDLIAHLESQVAQLQALNRAGQAFPVPLLADPLEEQRKVREREEREAERRRWEDKEREWRKAQASHARELADRDDTIGQLEKTLANSRPLTSSVSESQSAPAPRMGVPPATPESKHLASGKTKNSLVVCLYEDLTNLLVTTCKVEPGRFGEEQTFVCVLTSHGKSLQFHLRCFRGLKDSHSAEDKEPWVDRVVYTPLHLDKEKDRDWVERLEFLNDTFTFNKDQMSVFLATAHNKMDYREGDEELGDEDEDEEDE